LDILLILDIDTVKDRYGSDYENLKLEDDESSESESEDEDGEELTPAVDAAILRTLSRIRKRDPAIYDTAQSVFEGEA
jgi:protein KRI1